MSENGATWRHLVLVGLPGAGKTTVASSLAETLGWPHIELDARIEQREQLSIPRIFELHGESYFRKLEVELTREFLKESSGLSAIGDGRAVLDPGGGWATNGEALSIVRPFSRMAYLRVLPATALQRLTLSPVPRPVLGTTPSLARLEDVLSARRAVFESADWVFDTDAVDPQQVVRRLVELVSAGGPL